MQAKNSQVRLIINTLNEFCSALGLKVNYQKSRAICSANVGRTRRENFTSIFAICFTTDFGKYLGYSVVHERVIRRHFNSIIEKIQARLASWKGRLLNRAGRL